MQYQMNLVTYCFELEAAYFSFGCDFNRPFAPGTDHLAGRLCCLVFVFAMYLSFSFSHYFVLLYVWYT